MKKEHEEWMTRSRNEKETEIEERKQLRKDQEVWRKEVEKEKEEFMKEKIKLTTKLKDLKNKVQTSENLAKRIGDLTKECGRMIDKRVRIYRENMIPREDLQTKITKFLEDERKRILTKKRRKKKMNWMRVMRMRKTERIENKSP